jgi:transposase
VISLVKGGSVWVYSEPVDMRKSYDGLYGLIRQSQNPLCGDLYLFVSKDLTRAKLLHWDGTGLMILMKRLEKGRFADVFARSQMSVSELGLFFEGSKEVKKSLVAKIDLPSPYIP